MATKDLREKYEANGTKQALNRAIRAELPGGSEALDAVELVHHLHFSVGGPEIGRALGAVQLIVAALEAEIRRRYDMPPAE